MTTSTPWTIGDALAKRSCGGCVECCIAMNVDTPELRKEQGVPCRHLASGGCGIYQTRPTICREWFCVWRFLPELPEAARPDRCGVMFTYEFAPDATAPFAQHYIQAVALHSLDAFAHPDTQSALAILIADEAMPVWLAFGGRKTMAFPDTALADALLHPGTTAHTHLLEKAVELRQKWKLEPSR